MGYGVIGNTADSGSAILGSSPGTPAEFFQDSSTAEQLGGRMPVSYAGTPDRLWIGSGPVV